MLPFLYLWSGPDHCTKGNSWEYGLDASFTSACKIQLVSPLNKEKISTSNGGGGNWGGDGTIEQIETLTR